MYKLELHCHTSEVSACSRCPAETLIRRYKEAGYHGIVSTNHINRATFQRMESFSWHEKIDHFMREYYLLREAASNDMDVLLACEINLTPADWPAYIPNDYLVYGITEDWLRSTGDMRTMTLERLSACVWEAGFLIVHAHPFRVNTVMMNPDLLDGFEIFNGNPRHNSHNDLAEVWARMNGKIMTAGSDFHQPDDPCCGGIETETRIRDNEALLSVLRGGKYRFLRG